MPYLPGPARAPPPARPAADPLRRPADPPMLVELAVMAAAPPVAVVWWAPDDGDICWPAVSGSSFSVVRLVLGCESRDLLCAEVAPATLTTLLYLVDAILVDLCVFLAIYEHGTRTQVGESSVTVRRLSDVEKMSMMLRWMGAVRNE